MKKTIRFISLFLVIVICLSLCGCVSLDELRASSGIITDDGIIKLYDGTEYKKLDNFDGLSPNFGGYDYVEIVTEEVPVLLVSSYSKDMLSKSIDGKILVQYTDDADEVWYCRSDIYDYVVERIENGYSTNNYCYYYLDVDDDIYALCVLTQSQSDAINSVVSSQKPEKREDLGYIYFDSYVDLSLYSDDLLFSKDSYSVGIVNGTYYIIDYLDEYEDTANFYRVPSEFSDEFSAIMEKQVEEDEYWAKYE